MTSKSFIFFVCMIMLQISKEDYEKCEVEIIDKGIYFWVNRKDLEVESDVPYWVQIFDKCDPKKQKYRHELMSHTKFQQCRVSVRNDLVEKKLKASENHLKDFQNLKKLVLDPEIVTCDEQNIVKILHDKFQGETIINWYSIKNKRLDAYLFEYKIGIEIDEYNYKFRNFNYEESRTKMIKNHEITLIRTNPDDPNFYIKNLIIKIRICIKERIKKQTKN